MLVLVDGERLNTARQAAARTGAEVGLISPDAVTCMEIVNGAGTLLYGSDALATLRVRRAPPHRHDRQQLGLLANTYYREHFQFAPSRGRTFTVGVSAGAFQDESSPGHFATASASSR
jgi:hypothetical protein